MNTNGQGNSEQNEGVANTQSVHSLNSRDGHSRYDSASSTEVVSIPFTTSWRNDKTILAARVALNNLRAGNNEVLLQTKTLNISSNISSMTGVGSHEMDDRYSNTVPSSKGDPENRPSPRAAYGEEQNLMRSPSKRDDRHRHDPLPIPPDLRNSLSQDPPTVDCRATDLASDQEAASKCPIKFFDQHSPEEDASYLQSYTHEIPRSHEVCDKRYQTTDERIRQIDAEYDNLINMIKGLGMKYQTMLVPTDHEKVVLQDPHSKEEVEGWATVCTESMEGGAEQDNTPDDISHSRSGHFDRPLNDVRVGESPSRPWGIHVSYTEGPAMSTKSYASANLTLSPLRQKASQALHHIRNPRNQSNDLLGALPVKAFP